MAFVIKNVGMKFENYIAIDQLDNILFDYFKISKETTYSLDRFINTELLMELRNELEDQLEIETYEKYCII